MSAFHRRYGDQPLHLIAVVISFAIVGYALKQVLASAEPVSFALYFGGAIIAHDMIAFPIYSALHHLAGHTGRRIKLSRETINYVRVPAILAAFALVVWFPLILRADTTRYVADVGHNPPSYLGRWLALTAALFLVSGVAYAIRLRRARPGGPATGPPDARSPRSAAGGPAEPAGPRASEPDAR